MERKRQWHELVSSQNDDGNILLQLKCKKDISKNLAIEKKKHWLELVSGQNDDGNILLPAPPRHLFLMLY